MNFIFFLAIILVVGFLIYRSWIKNNWRKKATILAAVYQSYLERGNSEKESFLRSLEFYYKPPRLVNVTSPDEVPNISKAAGGKNQLRIYVRFGGVLIAKNLKDVLDEYSSSEKIDQARAIDILAFPQDLEDVQTSLSNARFYYNENDYSVTELIYCFLVIEHPTVVIYLPKEDAIKIINNFLQLSQNIIQATAKDPTLIKDMEAVEKL